MASRDRTPRVAVLGTSVQRSRNERRPSRARNAQLRRLILVGLVLLALVLLTISFRSPTSGALHTAQGWGASALRPFQVAAEHAGLGEDRELQDRRDEQQSRGLEAVDRAHCRLVGTSAATASSESKRANGVTCTVRNVAMSLADADSTVPIWMPRG